MAYRRSPGLLHSLPALVIGAAMVLGAVALLSAAGSDAAAAVIRTRRGTVPVWLAGTVLVVLGSAILLFGVLSLRQTWREVRHRPARDQWLGY
jgi:hypothetical protein